MVVSKYCEGGDCFSLCFRYFVYRLRYTLWSRVVEVEAGSSSYCRKECVIVPIWQIHTGFQHREYLRSFLPIFQQGHYPGSMYPVHECRAKSAVWIRFLKSSLLQRMAAISVRVTIGQCMWLGISIEQDNYCCALSHDLVCFRKSGFGGLWVVAPTICREFFWQPQVSQLVIQHRLLPLKTSIRTIWASHRRRSRGKRAGQSEKMSL